MAIPEISPQSPVFDRRSYSASVHASFTGGLALKTEEGDLVNLSFENEASLAESESQTRFTDSETIQEFSSAAVAASQYSLTVQGDLNAEELDAIQKLVDEVGPIARGFFAQAEFDFAAVTETLTGSLGVIEEISLELERVITSTFSIQNYSSNEPIERSNPVDISNLPQQSEAIDPNAIRNLPELVFASIEAEFEAQVEQLPKRETILRSLNDLMRFLREQMGQFLNPLGHSADPTLKGLPQGSGVDSSTQEIQASFSV